MISLTRIVNLTARVAAWATPKIKKWHRERNLNRSEAQRHLAARNWSEAERFHEAALAERKRLPADRVNLLIGLCEAQRGQRKLEAAEGTAGEALKLAIEQRDEILHLSALEALAGVQLDLAQFTQAEGTVNEVIRLESARPSPDYARLASCSRKLAVALEQNERHPEAIQSLHQAASFAEKAFGAEHPETAGHLHELGRMHHRQGRYEHAQTALRRALHIHRKASGADSHEATQALHNLAAALEESGNFDDAAAEYEKLLSMRDRQVGANPLETAQAQVRLAGLYVRASRLAQARELLQRAIPALERRSGSLYATALETMAAVEERSGRKDDARQYREKAMVAAALDAVKYSCGHNSGQT